MSKRSQKTKQGVPLLWTHVAAGKAANPRCTLIRSRFGFCPGQPSSPYIYDCWIIRFSLRRITSLDFPPVHHHRSPSGYALRRFPQIRTCGTFKKGPSLNLYKPLNLLQSDISVTTMSVCENLRYKRTGNG